MSIEYVLDYEDYYDNRPKIVVEEPDPMDEYRLEIYYAIQAEENAKFIPYDIEDYYFEPRFKPKQKIAFLSATDRKVLPMSKEVLMQVPPNQYNVQNTRGLYSRMVSTRGVGGLANGSPRFAVAKVEISPGPGQYSPLTTSVKPAPGRKYPFNTGARRFKSNVNKIPGVGAHDLQLKLNRSTEFAYCFNDKKYLQPAVSIKCVVDNEDVCCRCEKPPVGDYWVFDCTQHMCRRCMDQLRHMKKKKKLQEKLDLFQKVRDCSFMHRHEGTSAKIHLLEDKQVFKMQVKESYLSKYFK